LLVVPGGVCKWSVYPFTNPNAVYSHTFYVTIYLYLLLSTAECNNLNLNLFHSSYKKEFQHEELCILGSYDVHSRKNLPDYTK
jgi:hypothetical protein